MGTRQRLFLAISCVGLFAGCCSAAQQSGNERLSVPDMSQLNEIGAQYLPGGYAKSNFTLDDAKRLVLQKCRKAHEGGDGSQRAAGDFNETATTVRLETAVHRLMDCAKDLVNVTKLLEEIEEAKPRGDLDEVFEKYCANLPRAKSCVHDFNDALLPCMTSAERAQNTVMVSIVDQLLNFICMKNGDHIALFIAEAGPECLMQNKEHIGQCINSTYAGYMPKELSAAVELPELLLGPRQCLDLRDLERCVVRHVEQCSNITPANIVESIFRFVLKQSKCQAEIDKTLQPQKLQADSSKAAALPWGGVKVMLAASLLLPMLLST
ncbi:27 kDa hemolymph protein-like [Scaptodrosophila lebanonensis]|uniref:27 kDa hemolymph protein-like n=1 Tax=Drosophila lebanonensis TaxID=7225 RepID=A0A6J2TT15_DROLE|nr:27 kDa hemolymph protein-like [Scaptodrosophila lebanonensis]